MARVTVAQLSRGLAFGEDDQERTLDGVEDLVELALAGRVDDQAARASASDHQDDPRRRQAGQDRHIAVT